MEKTGFEYYELANEYRLKEEYNQAIEFYKKSIDLKEPLGYNGLGYCYEFGLGVKKNISLAIENYKIAADMGCAKAMNNLAGFYLEGEGLERNNMLAFHWFSKAADEYDLPEAIYNLGIMYEDIFMDYEKALEYYRKIDNNEIIQFRLGEMYKNGKGVDKDKHEAFKWYLKAAENGVSEAQFIIGNEYFIGNIIEKDYAQAIYWFEKAAAQNNFESYLRLADCYRTGKGVKQNIELADKWMDKAMNAFFGED